MAKWKDECYGDIHKGDLVYYLNRQEQVCRGRAVMMGPMGWVLNRGNGQPAIVGEFENYLGHNPGNHREKDHLGEFLHG